jgi:hypothetical protein
VPEYLNGDALLTDAVLRADGVGRDYGIVIVEGPTDAGVFAAWTARSPDQIVVAGKKNLAVSAHRKMEEADRSRIIIVVDCDGNAGQLCGSPNLVVTKHNDLEADLMMVDNLSAVVKQLLAGRVSGARLEAIPDEVVRRAVSAARAVEVVRHSARNAGISLRGHPRDLRFKRFRDRRAEEVDPADALPEVLEQHNKCADRKLASEDVERIERGIPGRVVPTGALSGKVLLAAAGAILNQDFGVRGGLLGAFDEVVRASAISDAQRREQLAVVQRVRRWEAANNIQLLAA